MPLASMKLLQFLISDRSCACKAGPGRKSGVRSSTASRSRTVGDANVRSTAFSIFAFMLSVKPLVANMGNQNRMSVFVRGGRAQGLAGQHKGEDRESGRTHI